MSFADDEEPIPDKIPLDESETGFTFPVQRAPVNHVAPPSAGAEPNSPDRRLYVEDHQHWDVHVKHGAENEYCFAANPGEDYFHLFLEGELYVQRGYEKYCLNCALRQGILTTNRLHWQTRRTKPLSE
jgi:hypothetical protein